MSTKKRKKELEDKIRHKSVQNIYQLDGLVPFGRALPFGLQHVLAMFVSNLTPITILAALASPAITGNDLGRLIQNAMFIAGFATAIQLFPIKRVGSGLPIVMGFSFTFVAVLSTIITNYGYPAMLGAVLIGGLLEGFLGLFIRGIVKLINPIVPAAVVCGIGLSLFPVGIRYFGGGYTDDYGSFQNLLVGSATLLICIFWLSIAKGPLRSLAVLVGLFGGYIFALCLGMVDLSGMFDDGIVTFPHFLSVKPVFRPGAILPIFVIYLVSATETIGDTSALAAGGLGRPATDREISGSLAVDGFASSLSSLFGCPPLTSFSQNVGLVAMTKVVNRFTIFTGAMLLMCAGFFPPIGNFFSTMPLPVLGGCCVLMFGQIMVAGIEMLAKCSFSQKNITVAAISLALGVGTTSAGESNIWNHFPQIIQDIFKTNVVAVVFVAALILSYILPEKMNED